MPLKQMIMLKVFTDAVRRANCSLDIMEKYVLEKVYDDIK